MRNYAKTLSDFCVQRSLNRTLINLLKYFLSLAYKSVKIQSFITATLFFSAQALFAQDVFSRKSHFDDGNARQWTLAQTNRNRLDQ